MKIVNAQVLINHKIKPLKLGKFYQGTFEHPLINVYRNDKGTFHGFGGAITYSTAYNYSLLSELDKKRFLEALVGTTGLGYTLFRLCIGSSDFATKEYTYIKENDKSLSTFNIKEDKKYIVPLIKDLIKYSKNKLHFIASCWSSPAFMKSNKKRTNGGKLLPKYYDLHAEYITKFVLAYKKEGINIEALTLQNEAKAMPSWESCTYTKEEEVVFAKALRKHLIKHHLNIRLFAWDHNRERLVERSEYILKNANFLSGIAFHFYTGDHFDAISAVKSLFPNKEFIETEFCLSANYEHSKATYAHEIINNLKAGSNAIIEWNLLLDSKGGPYHNRNSGCDAIMRLDRNNHLVYSKLYNQVYMFSHFIKNESKILWTSTYDENIKVAATSKNNETTINILNPNEERLVKLYYQERFLDIKLSAYSLISLVINQR